MPFLGAGAPTAKIAKEAGVAEGTLFTYFANKDELFNRLYLQLKADLAETMLTGYPAEAGLKGKVPICLGPVSGLGERLSRRAQGDASTDPFQAVSQRRAGRLARRLSKASRRCSRGGLASGVLQGPSLAFLGRDHGGPRGSDAGIHGG